MVVGGIGELEELINENKSYIKIAVDLNPLTKMQLFLTGKSEAGVEVFGVSGMEARNLFLVEYVNIINRAIKNGYRVHVYREGELFKKGVWYLEFEKEMNESVSE